MEALQTLTNTTVLQQKNQHEKLAKTAAVQVTGAP